MLNTDLDHIPYPQPVDAGRYAPDLTEPDTFYGLPRDIRFCQRCGYSNQKPNSEKEFKHNINTRKPTVEFDENGVCAACRVAALKKDIDWAARRKQLTELCDQYRRNDGHYDCLVPGSGGKDSFYAAHKLKYEFGMNPLTVTWAPHIYTDWGWQNFQAWIHAGFDNYLFTPNGRVHRLLTRLAIEKLFHPFQPFIMGQMYFPPRMAVQMGIPLVFYGEHGYLDLCGQFSMDDFPEISFRDRLVTTAMVDVDATRMSQARTASFQPDLAGDNPLAVRTPFSWPSLSPSTTELREAAQWESSGRLKEEEFTRAEALGLFDYMRKSRSRGFVVSLSGGADSAAITCLIALMVELATAELGAEGFMEKVARTGWKLEPTHFVKQLLTTAYQATENSGDVTKSAARAVAEAIGATHYELDVSQIHTGYVQMIEGALGRPLSWATDDISLQNIQARVRSPGIWMLANLRNALLLSTSNRSEAAVGYATMDGDTSGGLAPIAGIDKAWLREWLRWVETGGPLIAGKGCALPALIAVNKQAPTAELRPAERAQTDEADLMPYPLLDAIERAAIRDKQSPLEVFQLMRVQFPDIEPKQLGAGVERFFRLWCRNQWKRERYAPSFHLDDENLDPKTWCRWPILSGGFEVELAELQAAL